MTISQLKKLSATHANMTDRQRDEHNKLRVPNHQFYSYDSTRARCAVCNKTVRIK